MQVLEVTISSCLKLQLPPLSQKPKLLQGIYKLVYPSSDEESEPEVQYMESDEDEIYVDDMISSADPNHDTDLPILETPSTANVRKGDPCFS